MKENANKVCGLILAALCSDGFPDWQGRVVAIDDGDTLKVLTPSLTAKPVRLVEIDAPETGQAFGTRSRQALSAICYGKQAAVKETGVDRYERILGRVYCDGLDSNAEMVRQGMAWAYDKYLTDQNIKTLETEAKRQRLGLWQDAAPEPPWVYRKQVRQKR